MHFIDILQDSIFKKKNMNGHNKIKYNGKKYLISMLSIV